jgi:hypothetical protein
VTEVLLQLVEEVVAVARMHLGHVSARDAAIALLAWEGERKRAEARGPARTLRRDSRECD